MNMRFCGPALLAGTLLLGGSFGAEALPASPIVDGVSNIQTVQYNPGHHATKEYRRALRRYRGHPGAQFELRQNRRIYCRNTPERC